LEERDCTSLTQSYVGSGAGSNVDVGVAEQGGGVGGVEAGPGPVASDVAPELRRGFSSGSGALAGAAVVDVYIRSSSFITATAVLPSIRKQKSRVGWCSASARVSQVVLHLVSGVPLVNSEYTVSCSSFPTLR